MSGLVRRGWLWGCASSVLLVPLLVACGDRAGDAEAPAPAPARTAPTVVTTTSSVVLQMSPPTGRPGAVVTVDASGLPRNALLEIGFGAPRADYSVLGRTETNDEGEFTTTIVIPDWAEAGRAYRFVIGPVDRPPTAVSGAYHVTGPDGVVRIEGRITDEGVECLAMRSDEDDLYTLVGEAVEGLRAGDAVVVEATIAEMSTCMQGVTLSVSGVERP